MLIKQKLAVKFNESTRKVIRNSFALIVSQLFKYSINIFLSIWIVRYLGVELFGTFSYITALTGILGVFSALGLQSIVVRELVKSPGETSSLLGTSMTLSFWSGFLTFGLLIIVVSLLNHGNKLLFYLALINGVTFLVDTPKVIAFYYESIVESHKVARISNIATIVSSVLKVACIYYDLHIYFLSAIYVLEIAINSILLLFLFSKKNYSPFKFTFNLLLAKKLLKDSTPLVMSALMIGIFMKIDQVMINSMLGSKASGIFAVSVRLTEIFYFIPVILQSSLFPGIMAAKENSELFRMRINNLYSISIIFSYVIIIIMLFFSSKIIDILYGSAFAEAKLPLMISVWALLFVSIGVARNAYIIAHNLSKIYMYITILGAIINITLNSFLIPRYGIIGASVATICAQMVAGLLSGLFFKSLRADFFSMYKLLIFPKVNLREIK